MIVPSAFFAADLPAMAAPAVTVHQDMEASIPTITARTTRPPVPGAGEATRLRRTATSHATNEATRTKRTAAPSPMSSECFPGAYEVTSWPMTT